MTQIVVNKCYGGFGLSDKAVKRYCEIKGLTVYPEQGDFGLTTYWLAPPNNRTLSLEGEDWHRASMEERVAANKKYDEQTIYARNLDRDDAVVNRHIDIIF